MLVTSEVVPPGQYRTTDYGCSQKVLIGTRVPLSREHTYARGRNELNVLEYVYMSWAVPVDEGGDTRERAIRHLSIYRCVDVNVSSCLWSDIVFRGCVLVLQK